MKVIQYPISWEQLEIILKEKDYDQFGRCEDDDMAYKAEKIIRKKIYKSSGDMIKIKHLNYLPKENKDGKIFAVKYFNSKNTILTSNKFPYYVKAHHSVLWSIKDLDDEEIKTKLDKVLKDRKYIFFRNPEYLRSIPDLFHVHVFIKK